MTDKPSLFRKNALRHAAVQDDYDQLIRIVPLGQWLVLGIIVTVFLVAIVWSFVATVPLRVEGQGLLLSEQGEIYAATAPNGAGHIVSVLVKDGDNVLKGQAIATLEHPDLGKEVDVTQTYVAKLEENYQTTNALAEQEIKQHDLRIHEQKQALIARLAAEESHLNYIKELLSIREQAQKQGFESKQDVMRSRSDYYASQARLESLKDSFAQNTINALDFVDRWQQRLRDLANQLRAEKHILAKQQQQLIVASIVESPVSGIIISVAKNVGDIANGGDPIARITSVNQGMDALLFLRPEDGKRVRVGMEALVSPSTVKREEFGSIRADVISVSPFPVASETMMRILHNKNLIDQLSKDFSPIIVRVRLHQDKNTQSGFVWSSAVGPKDTITPGTGASARIIVRSQPPITLVIPAMKKILGLDA